jgi:hypothetical protein
VDSPARAGAVDTIDTVPCELTCAAPRAALLTVHAATKTFTGIEQGSGEGVAAPLEHVGGMLVRMLPFHVYARSDVDVERLIDGLAARGLAGVRGTGQLPDVREASGVLLGYGASARWELASAAALTRAVDGGFRNPLVEPPEPRVPLWFFGRKGADDEVPVAALLDAVQCVLRGAHREGPLRLACMNLYPPGSCFLVPAHGRFDIAREQSASVVAAASVRVGRALGAYVERVDGALLLHDGSSGAETIVGDVVRPRSHALRPGDDFRQGSFHLRLDGSFGP